MMEFFLNQNVIFLVIVIPLILWILSSAVKIVPQAEAWIIERLGKYHTTLRGGLHIIVPFIDTVRAKYNLQEQVMDIPSQDMITKDNVSVRIDGIVFYRVINPQKATYEVLDLTDSIEQLAKTTLRAEIGRLELDETLSSRETLNAALLNALDKASENWGAKVTRVEISDIDVPVEIKRAMELQLKAERQRRAVETEAEGQKNATIAEAEGLRQRAFKEAEAKERMADAKRYEQEKVAEGEANAIKMLNEAMEQNPQASEFILAQKRIEAFSKLAESDSSNKIVVPYEATNLVGGLTMLKDLILPDKGKSGKTEQET